MSRLEQDKWGSDSNWLLGQIQILNKPEKEIVVALFSNKFLQKHYLIDILKHNTAPPRTSRKVPLASLWSYSDKNDVSVSEWLVIWASSKLSTSRDSNAIGLRANLSICILVLLSTLCIYSVRIWGSCYNADSDSVNLRWSPRSCTSNKLPDNTVVLNLEYPDIGHQRGGIHLRSLGERYRYNLGTYRHVDGI